MFLHMTVHVFNKTPANLIDLLSIEFQPFAVYFYSKSKQTSVMQSLRVFERNFSFIYHTTDRFFTFVC